MPYLFSSIITIILAYFDISVLPRFVSFASLPLLTAPFLTLIILRDKTIFPIFLAFVAGLVMMTASGNLLYLILYIAIASVAKVIFANEQSYTFSRSSLILLGLFDLVPLLASLVIINSALRETALYIIIGSYILISYILLYLYGRFGHKYFEYVEKYTAERFR